MTINISKLFLNSGPVVEVSRDGDVVVAVSINGIPVVVSKNVEAGDIVVKHGGTSGAYILTDSFDTVRRALKLLEPTRRRA
jgi:hypothetical protein